MIPIAAPGASTSARIAAEAKAAPDPKPPFEIPANITAGMATAKKLKSSAGKGMHP